MPLIELHTEMFYYYMEFRSFLGPIINHQIFEISAAARRPVRVSDSECRWAAAGGAGGGVPIAVQHVLLRLPPLLGPGWCRRTQPALVDGPIPARGVHPSQSSRCHGRVTIG